MNFKMYHFLRYRILSLFFIGLLLLLSTTSVQAWDQELVDAAKAFALGKGHYTPRQHALILSQNYDVNLLTIAGYIDDSTFQACQNDYDKISFDIAKEAADEAGVYIKLQTKVGSSKPGTDSDYITGAITPNDVKKMQDEYNERFTKYLKDKFKYSLDQEISGDVKWTIRNDVDFMGDAAESTDQNFIEIAELNNAAYTRRGAALYEKYCRPDPGVTVGRPNLLQSSDYMDQMLDMINHRDSLLKPLEYEFERELDKDHNNPKIDRINAEMYRHRALQAKYMVRINVAIDNLKKWLPQESLLRTNSSKLSTDYSKLISNASIRDMVANPADSYEMISKKKEILDRQQQLHLEVLISIIEYHPDKAEQLYVAIKKYASLLNVEQRKELLESIHKRVPKDVEDKIIELFKNINILSKDSVDSLLAFFDLPDDFEIQIGSLGSFRLIQSRWIGARSGISGRKYATATWYNYNPLERRGWGSIKEAGQATSIHLNIVEYANEKDAESAYKSAIAFESLKAVESASQKESRNTLRQIRKAINHSSSREIYTILKKLEYKGGKIHIERMGSQQRSIVSVDFADAKASLISEDELVPLIRENTVLATQLLTSAEEIKKMKDNAKISMPGSLMEQFNAKPILQARFKVTKESSSFLVNSELPVRRLKQGVLRFGKCVIFIELNNSYGHVVITDDKDNSHIKSDLSEVSEWYSIENNFRRLAGYPPIFSPNISLRLSGEDSNYKGVAADGISELGIVADITGESDVLKQIISVQWQVTDVPKSLTAGSIPRKAKPISKNKERHRYIGFFKTPEVAPRQHTQSVRLLVVSKTGERISSKPIEFSVVPAPIIFVHGIWSAPESMDSLVSGLENSGATRDHYFTNFDYADDNYKSLLPNAIALRKEVIGLIDRLSRLNTERIKCARVNIVAHSLGGLLARMVILGRKGEKSLPGDGDKILKLITIGTPHQGSILADWYAKWKPSSFTDVTDPSIHDFRDIQLYLLTLLNIKAWAEESVSVRNGILEFGPAVTDMRTENNLFINNLNQFQLMDNPYTHIRYYLIAGDKPLMEAKYASVAAVAIYNFTRAMDMIMIRSKSGLAKQLAFEWATLAKKLTGLASSVIQYIFSGVKSQRFKKMVTEVFEFISRQESDGVVSVNSASSFRMFGGQIGGTLVVPANHFDLVLDPTVRSKVYEWLTKEEASQKQP